MKPNQKIFEFLSNNNYYFPQQQDAIYKKFYEQMVENLNLPDTHKSSFISQISKISTIAQDETQSRFLIQKSWKDLLSTVDHKLLFPMKDQKEIKDFQEFVERVVLDPTKYELKYVDELIKIFDSYFQSNRGTTQIIQRNRARMIICKLIWSKFIKPYDQQVQQKLIVFFDEIYAKKVEKFEQNVPLTIEFLTEDSFFGKIFDVIFDAPNQQGSCFNSLKYLIQKAAITFRNNMLLSLDIVMKFHQIYMDKDPFLFEKFEQTKPFDDRYVNDIVKKVQGNYDLKDYLKQLVCRFNQTSDYKKIMTELITKDIYNKEYESQQQLIQFLKEFDQEEHTKRRYPQQQKDTHNQAIFKLIIKLKMIEDQEKYNYKLYKSNFYELRIFQLNNIHLRNLQTNEEIIFKSTEQIEQFTNNYNF